MCLESPGSLVPVQILPSRPRQGSQGGPGLGAARATHQGLRCEGRGPAAWCLEAVAPERPESPPKGHAGKDEAT